jgi:hypothetical protein
VSQDTTNSKIAVLRCGDTVGYVGTESNIPFQVLANSNAIINCSTTGAVGLYGAATNATGVGITFPATQSASSDANTLDDYEEGTWTPTISYTTSDGDLSYATQVGRYTKVGNLVTITGQVVFSETTASGSVRIASLPFTSVNVSNYRSSGGVYFDNMPIIVNAGYGRIAENSTLFVMAYADVGGAGGLTATQTGSGSNIQFSITYQV